MCGRVHDNWNKRPMTARHISTDNGVPCGSLPTNSVYRNGDKIGSIVHDSQKHDMVLVDLDSGYSLNDEREFSERARRNDP